MAQRCSCNNENSLYYGSFVRSLFYVCGNFVFPFVLQILTSYRLLEKTMENTYYFIFTILIHFSQYKYFCLALFTCLLHFLRFQIFNNFRARDYRLNQVLFNLVNADFHFSFPRLKSFVWLLQKCKNFNIYKE